MKKIFFLFFLILFQSCSFDNRLGVWQNINENNTEKKDLKGLKSLSLSDEQFDKIIPFKSEYEFNLTQPMIASSWGDIYYNQSNNFENFKYKDLNLLKYRSKKISRNITSPNSVFILGTKALKATKG